MQSVIYDPLQEYVENYRPKHLEQTNAFFDELAKQSAVDVAKNRETVRLHRQYSENFAKLKRKHGWLVFWRVLMCITVVLIPLVILKTTPKIKQLKQQCDEADQKADELLAEAYAQMQPLCCLFTDMDAVNLVQNAVPLLK
ncbi:MAG: hypothetical protein IIV87_00720, partial [Oscillospiraceae bacterium]|nr:hypothetical protein [Oscillospiraceae bacterium]